MLFDTHCHLNDANLYNKRNQLIKTALENGVTKMVVVGFDLESSKLAVEIAKEYPNIVYAAVGIHPSEILKGGENDLLEIEKLINNKEVVAIGEIGLDYHWDDVPKELQKQYFEKQILLAHQHNLPFIVHMRDATLDCLSILKNNQRYINKGIMHCYSGSSESVREFLELGLYISFAGPLTFKNARIPKEALIKVPLNKLLFETDCPYLSPHPLRGKENEPSNVRLVVQMGAQLLNKEIDELGALTFKNAMELFEICEK